MGGGDCKGNGDDALIGSKVSLGRRRKAIIKYGNPARSMNFWGSQKEKVSWGKTKNPQEREWRGDWEKDVKEPAEVPRVRPYMVTEEGDISGRKAGGLLDASRQLCASPREGGRI